MSTPGSRLFEHLSTVPKGIEYTGIVIRENIMNEETLKATARLIELADQMVTLNELVEKVMPEGMTEVEKRIWKTNFIKEAVTNKVTYMQQEDPCDGCQQSTCDRCPNFHI